ncbi:hypothetical protein COK00_11380 [Bacillus cereus]|uniref:hypothetical protein n=1 Tax=Bacillus cereus TaxID=1396 RepID=UPI000BF50230|nr:hypothetical protein [Bacillus cereus]PFP65215.1 hypothetical protein COK00_11380 [Bacillus cereus]
MNKPTEQKEVLGIFITKNEVANLNMEHIHVSDFAIQTILKTIRLNPEVQAEVIDKMVERTPGYFQLDPEEQVNKIKTTLTIETVVEYLRLHEYIREGIDMIEVGIDPEGSIIVSAFYVGQDEALDKVFRKELTPEEIDQLEKEVNILDGQVNIYEEAKKRLDQMKADNVIPFQNRAVRRLAKQQSKARLSHK